MGRNSEEQIWGYQANNAPKNPIPPKGSGTGVKIMTLPNVGPNDIEYKFANVSSQPKRTTAWAISRVKNNKENFLYLFEDTFVNIPNATSFIDFGWSDGMIGDHEPLLFIRKEHAEKFIILHSDICSLCRPKEFEYNA